MKNQCYSCKIALNDDNWAPGFRKKLKYQCKSCNRLEQRQGYKKNKDKILLHQRKFRQHIKLQVFEFYGNCCQICGENNPDLLSLDHIDGNGRQHRKEVLGTDSGSGFYQWVNLNKPDNLRLLCFNCNCRIHPKIELMIKYQELGQCKYCGNLAVSEKSRKCLECDKILIRNKQIDRKILALSHYGNQCVNCGIEDICVLTFDHIDNNGAKHRKEIGADIVAWLIKHNFPQDNFQILCFNCNYLKYYKKLL